MVAQASVFSAISFIYAMKMHDLALVWVNYVIDSELFIDMDTSMQHTTEIFKCVEASVFCVFARI
jgi:hypothetical protein